MGTTRRTVGSERRAYKRFLLCAVFTSFDWMRPYPGKGIGNILGVFVAAGQRATQPGLRQPGAGRNAAMHSHVLEGTGNTSATWSVDELVKGNASVGTISAAGL